MYPHLLWSIVFFLRHIYPPRKKDYFTSLTVTMYKLDAPIKQARGNYLGKCPTYFLHTRETLNVAEILSMSDSILAFPERQFASFHTNSSLFESSPCKICLVIK